MSYYYFCEMGRQGEKMDTLAIPMSSISFLVVFIFFLNFFIIIINNDQVQSLLISHDTFEQKDSTENQLIKDGKQSGK